MIKPVNFMKQMLRPERYEVMNNLPKNIGPNFKEAVALAKGNINAVAERTGREPKFALKDGGQSMLMNMGPYTTLLKASNGSVYEQINKLLSKVTPLEYLK